MTDSPAIEELCDRIEWISSLFALRTAVDDSNREAATSRLMESYSRLAPREHRGRHELLRERLGLSETELQVVWFLAALAVDGRAKQAMLSQSIVGPAVTVETLRRIVYGERPSEVGFRELSPSGTLRRFAIIDRNDGHPHDSAETRWTWMLAPRILAWLHGDEGVDTALSVCARVPDRLPTIDELAVAATAVSDARAALRSARTVVVASGMPGLGRKTLLVAAAAEARMDVLVVDCRRLPKDAVMLQGCLRAIARECRLLSRTPLFANIDSIADDGSALDMVGRDLAGLVESSVLVTCGPNRPALRWERPVISVELEAPTSEQRAQLWADALGDSAEDSQRLACMYPIAPALIHHAAIAAKARSGGRIPSSEDLTAGIRTVLDDRLGHLTHRVTVRQNWEDLVLPQDEVETIAELIARIRERTRVYERWGFGAKVGKGLGVSALFSGPPGTGKTMVAALIARDLGLELYQVDLAKVVSKWIGESEKNLAALFDAAEAGHAILLFDEADALFGKRTEVKSSNDRYANLETNYLLQRLETYSGVCLLTSNHEANIDPAFQRRLSLHLRFALPEVDERTRLWRAMMPPTAPVSASVDFRALARRFELSGGAIRNAVLRAAFLAANESSEIAMTHLERAARVEYEGLGRLAQ